MGYVDAARLPMGKELQLNNNFWSIKSVWVCMEVEWRWTKVKFMFEALEGAFEGRQQRSDHKYPIARPTDSRERHNN